MNRRMMCARLMLSTTVLVGVANGQDLVRGETRIDRPAQGEGMSVLRRRCGISLLSDISLPVASTWPRRCRSE